MSILSIVGIIIGIITGIILIGKFIYEIYSYYFVVTG
jgi:hypothetical protein